MESFYRYKGYGIRYQEIDGTTFVEAQYGRTLNGFRGYGQIDGDKAAKAYIDKIAHATP